jgi:DNA modification methylase
VVELYSNPGETVLTPFAGVMSEVFSPVSMGRKAIGIELKDGYFKQGKENMKKAKTRFSDRKKQMEIEFKAPAEAADTESM